MILLLVLAAGVAFLMAWLAFRHHRHHDEFELVRARDRLVAHTRSWTS